jgi:hypothetical protein
MQLPIFEVKKETLRQPKQTQKKATKETLLKQPKKKCKKLCVCMYVCVNLYQLMNHCEVL